MNFDRLKKALREKEEATDSAASNRLKELEDKVEQQRSELHQYKMKAKYADELKAKLASSQAELLALKDRLRKGGFTATPAAPTKAPPAKPTAPGGKAPPAPAGPPGPPGAPDAAGGGGGASSEEVKRLEGIIAEREARIRELEALAGVPVAPPDAPPPDAPPVDGAPDAPPLDGDGPPPAPDLDGPPPAPDLDGPPPAPDLDGPPPAPGLGGGGGKPKDPPLPKKRVIKPKQKMKKLHWQKVEDRAVKESIWFSVADDDVKFDVEDFEATFCQKETKEKKEVEVKEAKKKVDVVKLVDEKRSYNADITLARFRMTHAFIRDAILAMDETVLDQDKLNQLIKVAPTSDEVETVQSFVGDVNTLGNTEKFYRCVSSIPRIERRLEFMLFKQQFKGLYTGFKENLDHISKAIQSLRTSRPLKQLLTICLAFGNYMNGNTPHGAAWGFKLATLNRLDASKSSDNATSLLHYLAEYVQQKQPQVKGFLEECSAVHDACRVEASWLQAEISKVNGIVGRIDVELQKSEESIIDRFVPVMREFHQKANKKIKKMVARLEQAQQEYAALLKYFGESNDKLQWEEFFLIFDRFFKQYKIAETQLEEIKEKKAKAEKAAAYKERMKNEAEEKKTKKAAGGGEFEGGEHKKKKKKKEKQLVSRVMTSLRNRRDSEYIRHQMETTNADKEKKHKKPKSKVPEGGLITKDGGVRMAESRPKKRRDKSQSAMVDAIADKMNL